MRVAKRIELDAQTQRELRVLSQRKRIEVRLQQRARIVLLAAKGLQNKDIAVQVGLDRRQVALWRQRFLDGGIDALRKDAPRSGRPASVMDEMESRIVQATLHEKPANATHWSTRRMAEHLGVGATTVRRAWRNNGLKPHLSRLSPNGLLARARGQERMVCKTPGAVAQTPFALSLSKCPRGLWQAGQAPLQPRTCAARARNHV
jgi:transposase